MKRLFSYILIAIIRIISLLAPVKKQVFCVSFFGKQYSDNPRAISEKMHSLYPDYKIVWYINRKYYDKNIFLVPSYVKVVSNLPSYYFNLFCSFCVIKNDVYGKTEFKRKNQFFIQTWHGDRGFKKVLHEITVDINKKASNINDQRVVDLAIAGSSYGINKFKTAFLYNGLIYSNGCPRNDLLFHDDLHASEKIKKVLGIDKTKKVLLYAPTFRKNKESVSIKFDISKAKETLGTDWVFLVRAHSDSDGFLPIDGNYLIDVSDYPDISDLLFISDAMITDYSSAALDFILKRKPIFLFCPDLEDYSTNVRDLKVNPRESGLVCGKSEEELLSFLSNMYNYDWNDIYKKCDKVYGITESGHASDDVCAIIDKEYNSLKRKSKIR